MSLLERFRKADDAGGVVVYVEDSKADAMLVSGILGQAGFQVEIVAADRDLIEEKIMGGRCAVLLVDQLLDEERGISLIAGLRGLGIPLPPTFLVSGSTAADLDLQAIYSGAEGFIAKGSETFREQLLEAVRSAHSLAAS